MLPMTPASDARPPRLDRRLLDAATEPYRVAGRFAYHFARGKLGRDPAFGAIVHGDWIPPRSKVLDLGCGQGLLASLLVAADRGCEVHTFPGTEVCINGSGGPTCITRPILRG